MVLERKCGPEMLCMLAKDLEWTVDALGISVPDIYVFAVEGLSRQSAGSLVKTKNQFLSMLSSPKWMEQALKYCDVDNKKRFLHAIISSGIGGAEDIRSILARAIKVDPSIRTFVETELSGPDKKIKQSEEESGLTSWRSYNRRQEQYRKLVEKDIPANSREMAVARSYGDLRENHEYKAAKEHQTILMRRKQEMEADLKRVRGTDFAGCSTDTAGIGTCVCLENKEGVKATWCLLGEWDYDKELGILSSGSELARKLTGLKVGDKVKLPGADHDQTDEWVVESVSAPTEEIKEWMRGREKG